MLTIPSLNIADAESLTRTANYRVGGEGVKDLARLGNIPSWLLIDKSGEVADLDGATLSLKKGGAFYAPSPLMSVAVHWPKLVAGAQSGELYHLEVQE